MLQEVNLNGSVYYADVNRQILYVSKERKIGTPFSYLTKKEKEQMEAELRFPRSKKEE